MRERISTAIIALLVAIPMSTTVRAQNSSSQPDGSQIICLANGHLLFGSAEQNATTTIVRTGSSSLVIANEKISFVCDSMVEAYWQKAARVKASDLDGQIALFQWCLKHKLTKQAYNQIELIQFMDISAIRFEHLHRQLQASNRKPSSPNSPATGVSPSEVVSVSPKFYPLPPQVESRSGGQFRPLPAMNHRPVQLAEKTSTNTIPTITFDRQVKPAAFEARPGAEPTDDVGSNDTDADSPGFDPPSIDELDELTETLPKIAVALYKRKIEPLFIRSCMAAGCHTPTENIMPLRRMGASQVIPRRLSQRNMHSVIRFADPNDPMSSPLLSAALRAHGGGDRPPIEIQSQQYTNLRDWVILVSNNPGGFHPVVPREFSEPEIAPVLPLGPKNPSGSSEAWTNSIDDSLPNEDAPPLSNGVNNQAPDLSALGGISKRPETAEPPAGSKRPRQDDGEATDRGDPLDPNEFNRKFLKKKND